MKNRERQMIEEALLQDFTETDNFNPANYDYQFSKKFEASMKQIFIMANWQYVSVGKRRIRRATALVLAAVLIMATAVCTVAVTKPLVKWLTSQDEKQGTMDVTFEVEDSNGMTNEFRHIKPKTPEGYRIVTENKSKTDYYIEYEGKDGDVIYYTQTGKIENIGLSLDNETGILKQIEINGNQGYEWSSGEYHALTWSNGIYLFDIAGTCELKMLYQVTKEIH